MQIVLASTSKYRQQLLQRLQLAFISDKAETDETPLPGESSLQLSQRLALDKAANLAAKYPDHLIIGSDQCASIEGEFLSKPGDFATAFAQLSRCSEQSVDFHTSVCLFNSKNNTQQIATDITRVQFRQLNSAEIRRYLEIEQPYDCAGSFKCEGLGISLFQSIDNRDPNALIGLPLIELSRMLREEGINPLAQES